MVEWENGILMAIMNVRFRSSDPNPSLELLNYTRILVEFESYDPKYIDYYEVVFKLSILLINFR